MELSREIEEAIQKLAGTYLKDIVSVTLCNVDSVDKDNRMCDCTPIGGNADTSIPKVRLMAEINDGFLVCPSVDSTVMVALSSRGYAYVFMYSNIDEVLIQIGESGNYTSFDMKDGLQQFNDGTFGGLVKVQELTNKINALENLVNNILNVLKTTTIPLAPTGTYPFAPLYAALSDIMPITSQSEIENTLITHGQ